MNYNEEYFTIEATGSGYINLNLVNSGSDGEMSSIRFYYWKNTTPNVARDNYDGTLVGGAGNTSDGSRLNYVAGDIIRLYRPEQTAVGNGINNTNRFSAMANCIVYGNIASLIGYADELPEKGLQILFYYCNFTDCSNLIIPWNTIPKWGMRWMFYGCTKFTKIPYLPATTVGAEGYHQMFRQCNGIVNVDFTEKMGCRSAGEKSFQQIFFQTISLQSIKIPANINYTGNYAWNSAFYNCSALNSVTCLDSNPTTNNTFNTWLNGVSATGNFIKAAGVTWNSGTSGIPTGWTIKNMKPTTVNIDYNNIAAAYVRGNHSLSAIYSKGGVLLWGTAPIDYNKTYLTFKILTDGTITYNKASSSASGKTIYYRKNNGSWTSISLSGPSTSSTINVVTGDIIEFYGSNTKYGENNTDNYCYFGGTASYDMYGNIRSLQGGKNFMNSSTPWALGNYALYSFFKSCNIVDASNLIFDISSYGQESCSNMFYECSSMVACTKILSGTSLGVGCFAKMFEYCTSLVKAPELPAITLNYSSYELMFYGCSSLNYIKAMFTTKPGTLYTANWVAHVSSTGTYIKNSSASYTTRGFSFIPADWTVETADA